MADEASTPWVTSAEIARIAGVGRAAVSNWRRRYPDFPKPVGGPATSPTFVLAEVERWLEATGKGEQLRTDGVTKTGTQRLDARARSGRQGAARFDDSEVLSALDAGDDADPGTDAADAADSWFARSPAQEAARRAERQRGRFAALLAALPPDGTSGLVVDPACGRGDLLRAAAARFGADVKLVGQDVDRDAVRHTAAVLEDQAPDLVRTLCAADSLTDDSLRSHRGRAAVVLCEPPTDQASWPADELAADPRWVFGLPALRDPELAWVQHCYELLRPNGTAVVAVAPRTCVQPSGRAIRAAMLRAGALRAVVALPKAADPQGSDAFLWVLRRPAGRPDRTVAMVDLGGVAPQDVPTDHAAWRAVLEDRALSREVAAIDLLDEEVALLPARFVVRAAGELATAYLRALDRLPGLLEQLAAGIPRLEPNPSRAQFHLVTLHELERVGSLRVRPRTVTPREGDVLVHAGGRPPTVASGSEDGRTVSHVIELVADRMDPYFLAAFLQVDAAAIPIANTAGTLSRDDLRRCRVPRLPPAQQQRYGRAFRTLGDLEAVLRKTADLSGEVLRTAATGLTSGALAPPD